jgi:hypothetical protein
MFSSFVTLKLHFGGCHCFGPILKSVPDIKIYISLVLFVLTFGRKYIINHTIDPNMIKMYIQCEAPKIAMLENINPITMVFITN